MSSPATCTEHARMTLARWLGAVSALISGLSTALGYQRREFSTDTWTWEIRPIVDQKIGRWYWAFNPAVERSLKGDNAGKGFGFTPAAKVSYDVTPRVAAGLEYYGDLGPIAHIDPS